MNTNLTKASELSDYFKFRLKYLAEHYPNNFELGSKVRQITNEKR